MPRHRRPPRCRHHDPRMHSFHLPPGNLPFAELPSHPLQNICRTKHQDTPFIPKVYPPAPTSKTRGAISNLPRSASSLLQVSPAAMALLLTPAHAEVRCA